MCGVQDRRSSHPTTVQNDWYLEAPYESRFPSRESRRPTPRWSLFRVASMDDLRVCHGAEMGADSGPDLLFRHGGPSLRPNRSRPALALSALRSDLPLCCLGGRLHRAHRFWRGDAHLEI